MNAVKLYGMFQHNKEEQMTDRITENEPTLFPEETCQWETVAKPLITWATKYYYRKSFVGKISRGIPLRHLPCEGDGCDAQMHPGEQVLIVLSPIQGHDKHVFCSVGCQRRYHVSVATSRTRAAAAGLDS